MMQRRSKSCGEFCNAGNPPLLAAPETTWHPTLTTYKNGNHSIRSQRFRYTRYQNGDEEVYDLQDDPNEWNNLAATAKGEEVAKRLRPFIPAKNVPGLPRKQAFDFNPETYRWTPARQEESRNRQIEE